MRGWGLEAGRCQWRLCCYWHSCHLRSSFHPSAGIDRGSLPLCNMSQMMDLPLKGLCSHEEKENTWTNTGKYAHISAASCHLTFGSISVAVLNLLTYYFTWPQPAEEVLVPDCKWDPDMQKSCCITSAEPVRSLIWDVDSSHPQLQMNYEQCDT